MISPALVFGIPFRCFLVSAPATFRYGHEAFLMATHRRRSAPQTACTAADLVLKAFSGSAIPGLSGFSALQVASGRATPLTTGKLSGFTPWP